MPRAGQGAARRWIRRLLVLLATPVVLLLLWLLAGFVGALLPGPSGGLAPGGAEDRRDTVEIRLVGTAIHYDLVLPLTPDLRRRFAFAADAGVAVNAPDADWLLVGWGARGFYTQAGSYSDIPLRAVARAALGDTAVIRLEAWRDFTPEDLPGTRVLHLSPAGLTALVARIEADLGPPMPIAAAGLTGRDAFFAARGRFSALRTCNVWVGEALRAADLSLGRWTPTPQALRLSLWWNG